MSEKREGGVREMVESEKNWGALLDYHDANEWDHPGVYAWDDARVLVKLSGWLVEFVPRPAVDMVGELKTPDATMRKYATEFLETTATYEGSIKLGRLTQWALRRSKLNFVCGATDDEGGCGAHRRERDYQRVMGCAIFDRTVIREALQWLFENRVDMDNHVRMKLVATPPGGTSGHHVLTLGCGEWTGVVMCCKPDIRPGTDPLEPS